MSAIKNLLYLKSKQLNDRETPGGLFNVRHLTKDDLIREIVELNGDIKVEKVQNKELLEFLELVKKTNGILGDITVELVKNEPDRKKVLTLSNKLYSLIEPFDKESQHNE